LNGLATHLPNPNGNTYIRPGKKGKVVSIDHTNGINLCSESLCSHIPYIDGNTYIRPGKKGII